MRPQWKAWWDNAILFWTLRYDIPSLDQWGATVFAVETARCADRQTTDLIHHLPEVKEKRVLSWARTYNPLIVSQPRYRLSYF